MPLRPNGDYAAIAEESRYLQKIEVLPRRVEALCSEADELALSEQRIREQLRDAREAAERDLNNLERLGELFRDCLVRSRLPGFSEEDVVEIRSPWFLPEVIGPEMGELATVSFATLGSGGKKTLFKSCFALAVHRFAVEKGALLPSLLMIDSPMKNISERENRDQFEGFHQFLYELSETELAGTQIILIDKEFCSPKIELSRSFYQRHMTVDNEEEPPLIPYYRERPKPAPQDVVEDSGSSSEESGEGTGEV